MIFASTNSKRSFQVSEKLEKLKTNLKNIQQSIASLQKEQENIEKQETVLETEKNNLKNNAQFWIMHHENPLIAELNLYLPINMLLICQDYNNFQICEFCKLYHLIGFCPSKYLSLECEKSIWLDHVFQSSVVQFTNYVWNQNYASDFFFADSIDQELWCWILDSFEHNFPGHKYVQFFDSKINNIIEYSIKLLIEKRSDKKSPPDLILFGGGKNRTYFLFKSVIEEC